MMLYVKQIITVRSFTINRPWRKWHVKPQQFIVCLAAILLSACRIEITSPADGRVTNEQIKVQP